MRTTTFSFIDHMPASVRDFPKRRAAEIAGFGALAGVACLCLALLTWSVSDPSLNHATNARVHNLLGAPGAIAADLVMQFVGLASAALLTPPAFWGWRLLTQRRLERPRLKFGLYLIGVIAAAALASLLPAPGSWPLPTGLGGVVGDAVLWIPRRVLPVSAGRRSSSAPALAALSILALAAAAGVGGASRVPDDGAAPNPAGRARAEALARFDDEEDEDEPSFGMVSIGARHSCPAHRQGGAAPNRASRRRTRQVLAHPWPRADAGRNPGAVVKSQRRRRRPDRSGRLRSPPARLGPGRVRRRAAASSLRPPRPRSASRSAVEPRFALIAARLGRCPRSQC